MTRADLDRQLVKAETCTVTIPELELTIPPSKGQLTTVECLVRDIHRDLGMDQPLRRIQNPEAYAKIEALLDKLRGIINDQDEGAGQVVEAGEADSDIPMQPFTLKMDDPAGNSFLEFVESMADPKWNMRTYHRTTEQNVMLGLVAPEETSLPISVTGADDEQISEKMEGANEEIYVFPGTCSSCGHHLDTLMKKVNIPYFKVVKLSVQYDL